MERKRILCVDDDPLNIELVESMLEDCCSVDVAYNGEECMDRIERCHFDLILLDIMMPVMDGREACRRLRARKETSDIPIVVVSAKSYQQDIAEMYGLGVDDYLTKPFSQQQLIDIIQRNV